MVKDEVVEKRIVGTILKNKFQNFVVQYEIREVGLMDGVPTFLVEKKTDLFEYFSNKVTTPMVKDESGYFVEKANSFLEARRKELDLMKEALTKPVIFYDGRDFVESPFLK